MQMEIEQHKCISTECEYSCNSSYESANVKTGENCGCFINNYRNEYLTSSEKCNGCGNIMIKRDATPVTLSVISNSKFNDSVPTERNNMGSDFIVDYCKKTNKSWNRNQSLTIIVLSFVEFFAAAVISIQAPFYPDVAREKGATAGEYGIVFGIFEITVFIMSPIYGSKMSILQPRRVFNWGILTTAICCVGFGLLDTIEGRAPFIWSCLVVRVLEAMGDAAFDTASFTIIAMEFPNSVGTCFAILEICFGFGLIVGPTLGGVLFQIGGYRLPFLTMGGCLFVAAICTYIFLPEPSSKQQKSVTDKSDTAASGEISSSPATTHPSAVARGGFHIFKMLKVPGIAMTAYSIVASTAGVGFLSANLDYHLDQFNLNKVEVGVVFIMNGGVYAATAPIWGWICDRTNNQKTITLSGTVFIILGFIFIGPIPHFPVDTYDIRNLPMTCFGLAVFGVGLSATLISAFLQILNYVIEHGYPDDISTYGLVSGLWTSMSALGYFIGPSVCGVAVDYFGFRWSSVIIIGGQLFLVLILFGHVSDRRSKRSKEVEGLTDEKDIRSNGSDIGCP